ncbi:hypothetical protein DCC79_01240 [bacterium]|nr:MAG: hypothetical protein DCC79_01240 [bacterium]
MSTPTRGHAAERPRPGTRPSPRVFHAFVRVAMPTRRRTFRFPLAPAAPAALAFGMACLAILGALLALAASDAAAVAARPLAPVPGDRPAASGPETVAQAPCGMAVQASVANGTLSIVGTDAADQIRVRFDAAADTVDVFDPATATTTPWMFAAVGLQSIHARLCDGDDLIVFDDSGGALASQWSIHVEGDGGADKVLGGVDLGAVSLGDALQMLETLRTAGDLIDGALDLLDASPGACATAPCLVADTAGVLRGAGEDLVLPAAAYVRDTERKLVQPAAATVREAHGRVGTFVTTFVSQTAQPLSADAQAMQADVELAVDDFKLLLPTARDLLTDTTTLYGQVASLGLDVQSRDPIGVFTRTIESHTTSIAALSAACAEDPEPVETTTDEDQQDPSGLSPACAELERRIEALESITDGVGDDTRPDSSAAQLDAKGDAFEDRGETLELAGDGLGDDEVATSRASQIEADGDALVAGGDQVDAAAEAVNADWEAWVVQSETDLESAGAGMDSRGQTEVMGAADDLRARAGTDVEAAAGRLRDRADQLRADLDALMAAAAPLLGAGGAELAGQSSTSCSITPAHTLSGAAGSDVLVGTGDSDLIEGGDGDDLIVGADGGDRLLGEDGNDAIFGADGGDEINGGAKTDVLVGNGADDCLYGGGGQTLARNTLSVDLGDLFFGLGGGDLVVSGDDTSDPLTEIDLAWGGDGADEMHLSHGGDLEVGGFSFQLGNLAFGEAGDDVVEAADGVDVVFGGTGGDTIGTGKGAKLDIGDGSGVSVLRLPLGDLVFGGDDGDTVDSDAPGADRADDDIDVVFGGGGSDTIRAYGGGPLSVGDAGDPAFELVLGNLVLGDAGEDTIVTGDGIDVVFAGAEGDTVQAGKGAGLDIEGSDDASTFRLALGDLVFGQEGADTLDGDDPAADREDDDIDVVFGGGEDDTIRGYGGGRLSIGDESDPTFELVLGNVVFGGDGDDAIATQDGIDVIFAGAGDDTAEAGAGDTLEIDDAFSIQLGDLVFGQLDDDILHGDAPTAGTGAGDDGIDVLFGGPGDDKLYGGSGGTIKLPGQDFCLLWGNLLFGGAGGDLLRGDYETWDSSAPQGGIDLAFGGPGGDTIEGAGGSLVVIGDITSLQAVVIWFGNLLFGGADDDTIRGADAADLGGCVNAELAGFLSDAGVTGLGGAADLILAGGGYDTVDAYDGIDFVFGATGDDTLRADDGGIVVVPIDGIPVPIAFGNLMFGGEGEDTIRSKGRLGVAAVPPLEIDVLFGGPCDDGIFAGDGFNVAFGNRGSDTIVADDGVNLLFGNAHDDVISAGSGLSVALGNLGDDVISGGADALGIYVLLGNRDKDDITGGDGLTVAFGNRGDDAVRGGVGVGILFGNGGHDDIDGGDGLTVAFGNRGDDTVGAGNGVAVLLGNQGADDVQCADVLCVALGNLDPDLVSAGGIGLSALFGNAGEDRVTTGTGLGVAFGNDGDDIVRAGGGGALFALGNGGDDVIVGGPGVNVAFGNTGNDQYFSGGGANLVFGNAGDDTTRGGPGSDLLFGNSGLDTLVGGHGGPDVLFGNRDGDTLGTNDGDDLAFGNRGGDHVYASDAGGCDLLFGNRGIDTLEECQSCDLRFGGRGGDDKPASCTMLSPAAPSRGEVRGTVRLDLNGDSAGDVGQPNVTVKAGSQSAVTDADGRYRITGLAANTAYSVVEVVPAGFAQLSPPTAHAVAVGGQGIDLFPGRDFVNRPRCAVAADGWGCVSAECEPGGAAPVPACRPVAVRRVMRCVQTGKVCGSDADCPCLDCEPSWEVVSCACVASDASCTLTLDPKTGPRCGGICPGRPGGPCQLQAVGDVYRCGCPVLGSMIYLPAVGVSAVSGPVGPTQTSTPSRTATRRVTASPTQTATPRVTLAATNPPPTSRPMVRPTVAPAPSPTVTARPSSTVRPTGSPSPRPTGTPRPAGGVGVVQRSASAGPGARPQAVPMTLATVALDGSWTVLDELMGGGAFYAPLFAYTSTVPVRIDVTDLFVVSDRNEVYLDGQLVGSTPPVADWTALGGGPQDPPYTADPAAAWSDAAFSKASFMLPAGSHVLTLRNTHIPPKADGSPYPDGTVAFRLTTLKDPTPTATPEGEPPTVTPEGPTPTATPGCAPRPAGMVAWWTLDEEGGAVALDSAGGHDGAVEGAAAVVPAKVAAGRHFDGGLVRVADAPALDGGDAGLSVDAWIRPAGIDGLQPIVTKRFAPADAPMGWSLHLADGRLGFTWSHASSSLDAVAPDRLSAGEWHLVAVTVRRGSPDGGKLYVDGALVHTFDTTPLAGAVDTDALLHVALQPALGRGQPARGFVGAIDEVELFDRPISGDDIRAIYAADRFGKCDKPRR